MSSTRRRLTWNCLLYTSRLAQSIYDTSKHAVARRHLYHAACSFYGIALVDIVLVTKQNRTYVIFLKV